MAPKDSGDDGRVSTPYATVLDGNPFSKLCTKVCTNVSGLLVAASDVLRVVSA
jgi:hypothetical protein